MTPAVIPDDPAAPRIALVAITRQGVMRAAGLARHLQTEDPASGIVTVHVPESFAGLLSEPVNRHEAPGHTSDKERNSCDFHANRHEGVRHAPDNVRLSLDFHANLTDLGIRIQPYTGPLSDRIGPLFAAYDQLVFFVSLGAVTRLIAPHLQSKHRDPGVLVIDEAGRFVIPALSGHVGGANAFAERIAGLIGATAVITTASDVGQTLAVDLLGREFGWRLEAPKINVTRVSAQVINGEPIALIQECGRRDWWRREGALPANIRCFARFEDLEPEAFSGLLWITRREIPPDLWQRFAERLVVYRPPEQDPGGTNQTDTPGAGPAALTPSPLAGEGWGEGEQLIASPTLFLGLGCDRHTKLETLAEAVRLALEQCGAHPTQVAGAATIDRKGDEPAILALTTRHGWPLRLYSAAELARVPVPNPSATVLAHMGTPAVAEAAALLVAGSSPPLPDPPPPGGRESGSPLPEPWPPDLMGSQDQAGPGRATLVLEKYKYRGPDGKNATVSIARQLTVTTKPSGITVPADSPESSIYSKPCGPSLLHQSLACAQEQLGDPHKIEVHIANAKANAPIKDDDALLAEREAQLKGNIHLAKAKTSFKDDLHPDEPVAPPKAEFQSPEPIAPSPRQGKLSLVSLGPGNPDHMTLRARQAIAEAEVVIGYGTYLKLIPELLVGKEVIRKGMTEELDRSLEAYEQARRGRRVALVSSGDIGVYGMAGPTYEVLLQAGWRPGEGVEVELVPGCTALATCASLVGAPLTHDFCAISLSDLLTPWPVIARRMEAAARGDFVIALYNPRSGKRTEQILAAQRILLRHRAPETPVAIVKAAYREDQAIQLSRLDAFAACPIGMLSTVLIGNSSTFVREGLMVTPRGYANKYQDLTGAAKAGERAGRSLSLGLEGWQAAIRDYRREHPEVSVEELAQRFDGAVEEILTVIHGTVNRDGGI